MGKRPRIEDVLKGVEVAAREEVLKDFRKDSCIASTRVVVRIVRHFGFAATPLPVTLRVYNGEFVRRVSAGEVPPPEGEALNRWCDSTGAWAVGVGFVPDDASGARAPKFIGHLVALVEGRWLVDASLDQAARPQHGIALPKTLVLPVTKAFLSGEAELSHRVGDCLLIYTLKPGTDYRNSPDWTQTQKTKRAYKAVVRHIEANS